MAFKLVGGFPESFVVEVPITAGVAIQEGEALDINGNVIQRVTGSTTIHTMFGIAREAVSTAATVIKVAPVCQGQIYEAATANNTHASNQWLQSTVFSDQNTLSNTGSDVTGPTGVALMLAPIGAVSNKKVLCEFTRLQSTST